MVSCTIARAIASKFTRALTARLPKSDSPFIPLVAFVAYAKQVRLRPLLRPLQLPKGRGALDNVLSAHPNAANLSPLWQRKRR